MSTLVRNCEKNVAKLGVLQSSEVIVIFRGGRRGFQIL
jgi:hypothetical protein